MVNEKIKEMLAQNRLEDVYALIRYLYRIGEPIVSDTLYDRFELNVRQVCPDSPYCTRTYDDDPIPYQLLKEVGVQATETTAEIPGLSEMAAAMNEDKSLGMNPVTSAEEAFDYFQMLRNNHLDFMSSLKVDGVNTKMLYVNGNLTLSMSRGRGDANSLNYMEGSSKIMAMYQPDLVGTGQLRITGESYVEDSARQYLRDKYDKNRYKTCKSSAISMLRVKHDEEDYKHLHTVIFSAIGLETSLDKMFDRLEKDGFETVPHILHRWEEIPLDLVTFTKWLTEDVMKPIARIGAGIPSDGCAIEVNDLTWVGEENGQYSNRQLALKFGDWSFKIYKGVITDIITQQKRVYRSVRVRIDPIVTDDDCKAQIINTFNTSILIENDLYKGKEVYFEKNAGAVNILIHGKRLQEILKKEGAVGYNSR